MKLKLKLPNVSWKSSYTSGKSAKSNESGFKVEKIHFHVPGLLYEVVQVGSLRLFQVVVNPPMENLRTL